MWQVDVAVNTAKGLLPFQKVLRSVKRKIIPPAIGPQHASVVSGGIDHIKALREIGSDVKERTVLEIGSGWFPIIPLMLRVAGAKRVYLTDEHSLMDGATLCASIGYVLDQREKIAAALDLPDHAFKRIEVPCRPGEMPTMLSELNLTYRAPYMPEELPPVDVVVSQTVFEHIAPSTLERLLGTMRDVLVPGGYMSHGIDNSDHRRIKDNQVGKFDFLKYSDPVWRLLCLNPQDYTNRLRHSDYKEMLERTGHTVVWEKSYADSFSTVVPHPIFQEKSEKDILTHWSHIVTRMAGP